MLNNNIAKKDFLNKKHVINFYFSENTNNVKKNLLLYPTKLKLNFSFFNFYRKFFYSEIYYLLGLNNFYNLQLSIIFIKDYISFLIKKKFILKLKSKYFIKSSRVNFFKNIWFLFPLNFFKKKKKIYFKKIDIFLKNFGNPTKNSKYSNPYLFIPNNNFKQPYYKNSLLKEVLNIREYHNYNFFWKKTLNLLSPSNNKWLNSHQQQLYQVKNFVKSSYYRRYDDKNKQIVLPFKFFFIENKTKQNSNYFKLKNFNVQIKNIFFKKCIISKLGKSFIMYHLGVFFLHNLLFNLKSLFFNKFIFKKSFFSFLKINEVKLGFLYLRKNYFIFKFINNNANFLKINNNLYSLYNFKNKNINKFQTQLSIFLKNSTNVYSTFKNSKLDFLSKNYYLYYNIDHKLVEPKDVRITRIKFKPGYQRLWRNYRVALKESLRLKFVYQKQLTKYLLRFFRKTTFYTLSQNEIKLKKILIYSKLLPDLYAVNLFLNHNLIFVNGICTSYNIFLFQNDLLQLEISTIHYIFFRWLLSWAVTQDKKFKQLIYKKSLPTRYYLSKTKKQHSNYTPQWIYNHRFISEDIKCFLEVDYLSMSAFLIFNPFILNPTPINDIIENRQNIYRMYNWKYIV